MARKPAPGGEVKATANAQAYREASEFLEYFGNLAWQARSYNPNADPQDSWKSVGGTYAFAFMAWYALSRLLRHEVRESARAVYALDAKPIRLGKTRPTNTVIEAVADNLGTYFRNVVYFGRRTPFDPDYTAIASRAPKPHWSSGRPVPEDWWEKQQAWIAVEVEKERLAIRERLGIKSGLDEIELMGNEWQAQESESGKTHLCLMRCDSIDFDELKVQLDREARAVLDADRKANERSNLQGSGGQPDLLPLDPKRRKRMIQQQIVAVLKSMLEDDALRAGYIRFGSVRKAAEGLSKERGTIITKDKVQGALRRVGGADKVRLEQNCDSVVRTVLSHRRDNGTRF